MHKGQFLNNQLKNYVMQNTHPYAKRSIFLNTQIVNHQVNFNVVFLGLGNFLGGFTFVCS
jgi:hypothetical protein